MPVSQAFCPAGISSLFEICTVDSNGKAIDDAAQIGARGGGFALTRGVKAYVQTRKSQSTRIKIRINSRPANNAFTTEWALMHLLEKAATTLDVHVDIEVRVPIAAGYGTSAAGTAAASLALADAANLPVTFNDLGRITHMAEVVNRTGLGTAAAVFIGGFVLVTEPGGPGFGAVDRLLFPGEHSIICAFLESMPTRDALSHKDLIGRVNPSAQRAMREIREKPDLCTFLTASRKFGRESGFETPDIASLIDGMISAGAIGAAQNMIGRAVHGVVENRKAPHVLRLLKRKFPKATVFITHLDDRGVRLTTERRPKH